jgi:hypothetical protein
MLLVRPRSLWKYNWKSLGVLIVEPISSTAYGSQDEIPNICAKLLGSFGDGPFAIMVEKSLQRGRRAEQRHAQFLPHNSC